MTGLKCIGCGTFWAVHTLWPTAQNITHTHCPHCVGRLPRLDVHPIRRPA